MFAKIYKPAKTSMQSGKAKTQQWVIEFVEHANRSVDPLMGWTGIDGTQSQVKLTFQSREDAIAYAKRKGVEFQVVESREPKRIIKTYADNFSADRKRPWTH